MPERKCEGCKSQKEWGCFASKYREAEQGEDPAEAWLKPAAMPMILDDEESYACPRQSLREQPYQWQRVLAIYSMYRQGFLPARGAVLDQSHQAIEVFQILDAVNAECDAELEKKAAKGRRGSRGQPQ